jgi:hypothetical protein
LKVQIIEYKMTQIKKAAKIPTWFECFNCKILKMLKHGVLASVTIKKKVRGIKKIN